MRSIQSLLDEYGESHRDPVNKTIHWICVPLILWSVMALLWALPAPAGGFPASSWAVLAVTLAQIYYFVVSPRLALGILAFMLAALAVCWLVATYVPAPLWLVAVAVFVGAWIGQFVGHHIEGKKPSFFKDIQFLLIGPAWLMAFVYRRQGWRY